MSPARRADDAAIDALLAASHLPPRHAGVRLTVARDGAGDVVGVAGVEPFGRWGLLRSVAVRPEARGTGVARRLVAAAEAASDADVLVLLTTDAAPVFAALGYTPTDRADVPADVRTSAQFSGQCPSSAACLSKRLRPS